MKVRTIHSADEANELISLATRSATKALAQVSELAGTDALSALWSMKVRPVGCDPLDADTPLNLIEQLNQTFTYIASARAVKVLLSLHPEIAPFTLNLGTSPGSDIESKRGVGLAAEVFAAVIPSNNKKLTRDIDKVAAVTGVGLKYVFFMCPGYDEGRQPKWERPGIFVWSVEAEA